MIYSSHHQWFSECDGVRDLRCLSWSLVRVVLNVSDNVFPRLRHQIEVRDYTRAFSFDPVWSDQIHKYFENILCRFWVSAIMFASLFLHGVFLNWFLSTFTKHRVRAKAFKVCIFKVSVLWTMPRLLLLCFKYCLKNLRLLFLNSCFLIFVVLQVLVLLS